MSAQLQDGPGAVLYLLVTAGVRGSGPVPPHILEQGSDHAREQEIDHVVHKGRDIRAVEPIHPGEGKSRKIPAHNHAHDHTDAAIK